MQPSSLSTRTSPINPLKIAQGMCGYLLIVFPLAYTWHLVAFEATYRELGYFAREEPIIAFGFGAIAMQGLLLSFIYPHLRREKTPLQGAATFALVMGTYHWTTHVLAEAAKHPISPLTTWFVLETAFLAIQFTLGGLMLAWVYRDGGEGATLRAAG
ncbi:MAG: hypothetical protein KDA61_00150 [Planctomycetales bacterium]|nr:hypothetical protein [Planctomycetales bacterium]